MKLTQPDEAWYSYTHSLHTVSKHMTCWTPSIDLSSFADTFCHSCQNVMFEVYSSWFLVKLTKTRNTNKWDEHRVHIEMTQNNWHGHNPCWTHGMRITSLPPEQGHWHDLHKSGTQNYAFQDIYARSRQSRKTLVWGENPTFSRHDSDNRITT